MQITSTTLFFLKLEGTLQDVIFVRAY